MPPKSLKASLGKAIIRDRFRGNHRPRDDDTRLYTTDMDTSPNWMKMQSITQENDLDAFLRNAELAGTEFKAEKLNMQFISTSAQPTSNPYLLSAEEEIEMHRMMEENKDKLTVPRRPNWSSETTADELHAREREEFLNWRRRLAIIEEDMGMIVTPFERNIEVWRQLWRVLERSDIIVQIVDARNPLFFYSEDLFSYAQEINPSKHRLLLVNKADFLTESQRKIWSEYFKERNIEYAFFSAAIAIVELDSEQNSDKVSNDIGDDSVVEEEVLVEDENFISEVSISKTENDDKIKVLSCPELYDLFESFSGENEAITVGLVGFPNVGKSSTINALVGQKKVTVSATPGKTKHFQTIVLSEKVTLCDCPGLVFPMFASTKAEMVCNGVLSIDQLREYTAPATLVSQRIPRFLLEWKYGITLPKPGEGEDPNRPPSSSELLSAYAAMRGFRKAGQGNPDEARAARIILKEYVKGDLLFCKAPPGFDEKEFNEENYLEGGLMFNNARVARSVVAQREAKQLSSGSTPITSGGAKELDKSFFKHDENGKVRTRGKFASGDFHRVDLYPHQSGYSLGNIRTSGTSVSNGSMQDLESLRDKKHKGKSRQKDRSWRVR